MKLNEYGIHCECPINEATTFADVAKYLAAATDYKNRTNLNRLVLYAHGYPYCDILYNCVEVFPTFYIMGTKTDLVIPKILKLADGLCDKPFVSNYIKSHSKRVIKHYASR